MWRQNLRFGWRQLRRSPGVAAIAVVTLALGIGMTGAMFSVLYAVLLQPLPFGEPDELVIIGQANQADDRPGASSLPNIRDWREQTRSLEELAYWQLSFRNITKGSEAELSADVRCSTNLFSLLKTRPALGTVFGRSEDQGMGDDSVVLSAKLWKGFFDSDPGVIGQTLEIGGSFYTIIGVMPDGFVFPLTQDAAVVWIPIQHRKEWEDRNTAMLQVIGRLNTGVSSGVAQSELTEITRVSAGSSLEQSRILAEDYRESISGHVRRSLLYFELAVLAVWLISCVNIVSLMLARAVSRGRETALRCALGASQRHLLGQFFAESAVLGGLAGLLGLLLAIALLWALRAYLRFKLPFADAIGLSLPALGVILLMSLLSILIVGIWPALHSRRTPPQTALREGGASVGMSRRQRRVQDILVVSEVALSFVLVLNAGLLLRSINNLRATPLGFDPERLVVAEVPGQQGAGPGRDVVSTVYEPLLQSLEGIPGVESAAISTVLPIDPNSTFKIPVQILGKPNPSKQTSTAEFRLVSPDLHQTLGVRLIAGRYFSETDTRSSPWVLIVNRAFVSKFFADEEPLGQQVRTDESGPHKFSTIVGVVEDVRQKSISDAVVPQIDLCYRQLSPGDGLASLLGMVIRTAVRTSGEPALVIPSLRAAFKPVNQEVPASIHTMQDIIDRSVSSETLAARLMGIFGACGLLIAIIGLYGLLAYNVSRSRRDIAVRLALGATRSSVIGLVVRHAMLVLGIGLIIGFAVWNQTATLLRSYLYGIGWHDALTLTSVGLTFLLFALIASYVPARQASLVDPMNSLRSE